jgi:hypothetical protein
MAKAFAGTGGVGAGTGSYGKGGKSSFYVCWDNESGQASSTLVVVVQTNIAMIINAFKNDRKSRNPVDRNAY